MEIVRHGEAYRLRVCGQLGRKQFKTIVDGKATAFDLLEANELSEWLKKKGLYPREQPWLSIGKPQ